MDYVVDLVKEHHASGLLMIMTKFCDPEEFDYVFIKKLCEEQGISMISVEVDRQMVLRTSGYDHWKAGKK